MKFALTWILGAALSGRVLAFSQYRVHDIAVRDYPTQYTFFSLSNNGTVLMSKVVPYESILYTQSAGATVISHPSPRFYGPAWVGDNGDTAGLITTNQFVGTAAYRTRDGVLTEYEKYIDVSGEAIADRNSLGISVGTATWFSVFSAPLYWTPDGQVHELQNFGDSDQYVFAINDRNRIIGAVGAVPVFWDLDEPGTPRHVFQRSSASIHHPAAINEHDITVGTAYFAGRYEMVLWNSSGSLTHISNTMYGFNPFDINDDNVAVGALGTSTSDYHGALWSQDEGFVDVNSLLVPDSAGYEVLTLNQINNRGQAVGLAVKDGIYRGVFLEPVPEPATLAALGLGLAPLLRRRRN